MNTEAFDDLKQFIDSAISQNTANIREDITRLEVRFDRVDERFDLIDAKMDDLSNFFADTFAAQSESLDPSVEDHEKRIKKLETKVFTT